jgi:DNA-binding GntR family transcriptional regulator
VTAEDLAEMQAILDELGEAALVRDEPGKIVELDLAFHDYLCRLADHSRLYAAWESVSTQARVLIALTSKTHYDHPQEPKELHQRILDACRKQDLASGEQSLREHLLDAQRRARMALDSLRKSWRANATQGERVR